MVRPLLLAVCAAAMSVHADYLFPSANPPGNRAPADVKQFVTLIFDDNGYSGKSATQYEAAPGANFSSSSFIDGIYPWGNSGASNTLNLTEGMMGMSWATTTLMGAKVLPATWTAIAYAPGAKVLYNENIYNTTAWTGATDVPGGTDSWNPWKLVGPADRTLSRKNPDGSPMHFTFNVISGLMIPVYGAGWESYESKLGFWVPTDKDYPDGKVLHTKIAIAWGREMAVSTSPTTAPTQGGQIITAFQDAIASGHEIGNHTIDHMESNSPLSKCTLQDYLLDGKDTQSNDVMPWGETIDEAALYGQTVGATAQTMGWLINAGKIISKAAWRSAIDIGEKQLDEYLNMSVAKGNVFSFRAPRLEVNSGMFYALKEAGYQYDCGLEEGYEEYVDGTNFVWPYTTDNGSPNVYTQKINGERLFIDSMPVGFWEIPVNCFIVPQALRSGIYTKYHQISAGAGEAWANDAAQAAADSIEWCTGANGGKITGFDFNMFILWGLSKDEFIETMKYNLDLRLAGNKAPMQYGCHTDYYTPVYDNATLLNNFNKNSYGLVVSKGWNTWKTRQEAVEAFLDYASSQGAYVVSGHELIGELNAYRASETIGSTVTPLSAAAWEFFQTSGSSSSVPAATGAIENAAITMAGGQEEYCGYAWYPGAGSFSGVDHISLSYKTTNPILVKLVGAADKTWEVLLNNIGPTTASGQIPVSAFHATDKSVVPLDEIVGIELQVVNVDSTNRPATVSIKDITLYSGAQVGVRGTAPAALAAPALGVVNARGLSFTAPKAGLYTVGVFALNGKLIQSITTNAAAGVNSVDFANRLAPAMYLVKIDGAGKALSQKAMIK